MCYALRESVRLSCTYPIWAEIVQRSGHLRYTCSIKSHQLLSSVPFFWGTDFLTSLPLVFSFPRLCLLFVLLMLVSWEPKGLGLLFCSHHPFPKLGRRKNANPSCKGSGHLSTKDARPRIFPFITYPIFPLWISAALLWTSEIFSTASGKLD